MSQTHTYVVDVFQVELVEAAEEEIRPWESEKCECTKFHERERTPRVNRQDDIDCQHIRRAKLFHQLRGKVSPVATEDEDGQQPLDAFADVERSH